jgi:hypothetical protein
MELLIETRKELLRLKGELLDIRVELKFARFLRVAVKAGFKEEQPRDELGRWTSTGGIQVTTSSGFLTGISTIDDTSQALGDALVRVMERVDFLPGMSPGTYGTAVHIAFGAEVKSLGISGLGDIERSFSLNDSDPRYGLLGTIRTDVILRNIQGDIIAIYDVKTGERPMSQSRANELRVTRAAPNTPVFELNIVRGPSRKYRRVMFGRTTYVARTHAMLSARRA